MKEKYTEKNMENILNSLKHKEISPKSDFTLNVMQRIKNDSSFDDDIIKLDETDDILEALSFAEEVKPSDNFTNNVMARIKAEQNFKYNEENIDNILHLLSIQPVVEPSTDFTNNVMAKIDEAAQDDNIISFEKVYKKFLIGSAVVAAAAVLLALNLFSNYDPAMAEFMVTDYFNTGLYR